MYDIYNTPFCVYQTEDFQQYLEWIHEDENHTVSWFPVRRNCITKSSQWKTISLPVHLVI